MKPYPPALIPLAALVLLCGCALSTRTARPYDPQRETDRRPGRAEELNFRAAEIIDTDPPGAERLLREALGHDLYHGPAHNNLGVLYLKGGKLYEAAGEFEWAKRLLPGHPDPRMNLALVLEKAGRTQDAILGYQAALETYPDHTPTLQALARLQVRSGAVEPSTLETLEQVALRGDTAAWRQWARIELEKRK